MNSGSLLTETGRYSFYATRYDYLRIAKTIMDDVEDDQDEEK